MSEQEAVIGLLWNNYLSVSTITLILYEYLILLDKEVNYVWKRPWSLMSCLYLVVRYLGLSLSITWACWGGLFYMPETPCYDIHVVLEWGGSVYFCFAEAILIWRLYALSSRSKLLLYVLLGTFLPIVALLIGTDIYLYSRPYTFSVKELVTPVMTYCTFSFNIGPMPAIYTSIPIGCYDVFLCVLAVSTLVKHFKEQRNYKLKPNAYMVMIVRYHILYFLLNLMNQISLVILWGHIPIWAMYLSEFFSDTAPFILAPRLIISIWDTHAKDTCVEVSATFEDCVCLTSPPRFEQHAMDTIVV